MKNKSANLVITLALGLGLTLGLLWLLSGAPLPVVRAASFTVTKLTDTNDGTCDADCSLREAIVAANGNAEADTITLGAGTYVLTITGTGENASATGDLDISDVLTITGLGPGQTIIDASGVISDRVLDIRPGAGTVVISGVTIMNGNVNGNGGGIYDHDADLWLINTVISNNIAYPYGGGVFVDQGSATLSGGQIVSNTAPYGGGVYISDGSATLSGGQITSNTAIWGGGVYILDGSATLSGGQIISNTASGSGGGVCVVNYTAAFTQTGASIIHNHATDGGGVYIRDRSVTLSGGQIVSNTATDDGGGVFVGYGNATFSGGQIISNTAKSSGGGVYVSWVGSVFTQTGTAAITHNRADDGSGVFVYNGSATLSGGQIVSNTAEVDGGGIYVYTGTLTLLNTTVSGNRAASGEGGGLYSNDGTSAITYTTVTGNIASSGGGGVHHAGGTVRLQNTIVAHNGTNCSGALISNGYNLDSGDTCGFTAGTDLTDTDPLLGPLTADGGNLVHPLLVGSPAIDAGLCLAGVTTDQRGQPRPGPASPFCDIGAYEKAVPVITYLPLLLWND